MSTARYLDKANLFIEATRPATLPALITHHLRNGSRQTEALRRKGEDGSWTNSDPAYTLQQAPDTTGAQRQVIVFNLLPLGERGDDLPLHSARENTSAATTTTWTPPNASDIIVSADDSHIAQDRVVTRIEHDLQAAFGAWLQDAGATVKTLKLPTSAGTVEPDLYVPDRGWVVEAKKSTARTYVRMAIGQVLDYAYLARKNQLKATPVILLPGQPEADLKHLISNLGITLATRTPTGFTITEPAPRRSKAAPGEAATSRPTPALQRQQIRPQTTPSYDR